MNAKTLKALKASIAHWTRLATGKKRPSEAPNRHGCALCLFFRDDGCVECPVQKRVGQPMCLATPYSHALNAFRNHGSESVQFRRAASKELAFLKSLLPKKRKARK